MNTAQPTQLIDRFNRPITYARISVTDRCDFRCIYCMSETMQFLPRQRILTLEELEFISQAFIELGVKKIRFTGGEPLLRNNVLKLFQAVGKLDKLEEMVLTTNGSQLSKMAVALHEAGIKRINISLDSLKVDKFKQLTRVGNLNTVLAGIDAALDADFESIKINVVIIKGQNDNEIMDLVNYAMEHGIDISFIEEMPLGEISQQQRMQRFCSSKEILSHIQQHLTLLPTTETTGGPARYYRVDKTNTRIGFISPHSHNFCDQCNRVRVTVEGRLLLCLGQEHSVDLKQIIRSKPGNMECLKTALIDAMAIKPKGHKFELTQTKIMRHMNVTGG